MTKEIELGLQGAVVCPSCEYGLIYKAYAITFSLFVNSVPDANAHCKCPYCGETVLIGAGDNQVSYGFSKNSCKKKAVVITTR